MQCCGEGGTGRVSVRGLGRVTGPGHNSALIFLTLLTMGVVFTFDVSNGAIRDRDVWRGLKELTITRPALALGGPAQMPTDLVEDGLRQV